MKAPVVGFDLDMTLIDSRPGVGATYRALAAETGTEIDVALVTSRLGPPLELELANWFPAAQVQSAADRYRALYPNLAVPEIVAMPGADAALAAVRRAGGTPLVITAKNAANARLHVEHLGLEVEVVGDAWREGKADVLREREALVYVGDHVHDVEAARSAGVVGIGVATGPCSEAELREAGADHVVPDLHAAATLLRDLLGDQRREAPGDPRR